MKDQITSFINILHNNTTPSKNNNMSDAHEKRITTIETLTLTEKTEIAIQTEQDGYQSVQTENISFDFNTKTGGEQFLIQEQNRMLRDYHNQLEMYRKRIDTLEKRDDERKKNIDDLKKILMLFSQDKADISANNESSMSFRADNYKNETNTIVELLLSKLEKQSSCFEDLIQMQQTNRNYLLSSINKTEEDFGTTVSMFKNDLAIMKESILIQNKKMEDIIVSRIEDFKIAVSQLERSKIL